jgi:hypothetical protein
MGYDGVDCIYLAQERDQSEHGDEPVGSIKDGGCLDQLSEF